MAIFVLHVKAERFVTKRETLLKKRRRIFTYFATMQIKNEKKEEKSPIVSSTFRTSLQILV